MRFFKALKQTGRPWLFWGATAGILHFSIVSFIILVSLSYTFTIGEIIEDEATAIILSTPLLLAYSVFIVLDLSVLLFLNDVMDLSPYWFWAGQCVLGSILWVLIGAALGFLGSVSKRVFRKRSGSYPKQ